jgi:hypothetical protein
MPTSIGALGNIAVFLVYAMRRVDRPRPAA